MADPFIAEIRIFPFNFAPIGWAWCDGQLMPVSQNTALFSLLGSTYGGNGTSTFALPNLQGRAAMQPGQGPGLSLRHLGEQGGSETVTLFQSEMPAHNHALMAQGNFGNTTGPADKLLARPFGGGNAYKSAGTTAELAPQTLAPAGGTTPHNNMQPYLTMYFNIALQGVFPPRS